MQDPNQTVPNPKGNPTGAPTLQGSILTSFLNSAGQIHLRISSSKLQIYLRLGLVKFGTK